MMRYAALLLALTFVTQGARSAEADAAADPVATARFQRALDLARAKAADIPLTVTAVSVSTLAATSVGSTAARLNGTLDTGGGLPAFGYFKYGLAANALNTKSPQQLIGGNGVTPFLYDVAGLACDTQYFFQAAAEDSVSRDEIVGSVLNFTTSTCGPTATTNAASTISTTAATLNATVNPKGAATAVVFDYGETAALGLTTDEVAAGNGQSGVPITKQLTPLTCGTQYFFRVRASNANGSTQGTTLNFTTSQCVGGAPEVTTSAATGISATGATLNGTADPNGNATTAAFDWGPTPFLGSVATANAPGSGTSPVAISAALTQLACGTQYFFRARATNSGGSAEGTTLNFTTSACPVTAPGVVTQAATSITTGGATLNGTVDPNGFATTAKFEYGAGSFTREENVASPGAGNSPVPISAPITDLECGTQYVFRASATNASGTVTGTTLNFNTSACSVPKPAPTVVTSPATDIERTTVTLNGTVDPNGFAATAQFQYGTSAGNLNQSVSLGSVGSGNSPVPISTGLSNLVCETTYYFRARGTNSGGSTNGTTRSFTTSNCIVERPTVTTAAATAITANGATLNGTVDPNLNAATAGFQYGLAANALFSAIPLGSVGAGNSPVSVQTPVGSLLCNRPYYFRAFGSNGGGTTFGPTLSFVTGACPVPGPVAITEPISGLGPIGATLNGTVDPNGSLTTVYFDFGTTPELGTTVTYAQVNGGTVPVSLPTQRLLCDTTYWYRVRADSAGGVSIGGTASFTTGPCGGACVIDFPLSCGTGDFWNNSFGGSTNAVDTYYCNTLFQNSNQTGPEYTYRFVYPETVQATVVLSGLSADLDLFVLDATGAVCNGTNCFGSSGFGGTSNETLSFTAIGGTEYYVVVEGYGGATSNYSINATCTEPTLAPDVTVGTATRVTLTEATVRGTVNPNGAATTVYIDYGIGPGALDRTALYGNAGSGSFAFGLTVELSGLVCGNTYYYRLRGVSAAGTDLSTVSSFTTAPCGTPVCRSDFPLNCGTGDSWGNAQGGSTNTIPGYTCNGVGPLSASGPEYTYFFTPTQFVYATVNLTGLASDLDLYALTTPGGICTGNNCIASSRAGGNTNESISFVANPNQTYNINVDGFAGSVSTYSINMSCVLVTIFEDSFD